MSKKVLIVVDADPRQTHRAAEGLRLAAGLAAWMTTEITVCLLGPASVLLEADEEWLGEEDDRLAWPLDRARPAP